MFFENEVVRQPTIGGLEIIDIEAFSIVVNGHNKRMMLNAELMIFTKDINKTFTHISIYTTLDWVVDWWDSAFNLKENIKEPF